MTDPVVQDIKTAAAAEVAKAQSWFSKGNLYPFSIGAGSTAGVWALLHFALKML